MTATATNQTTSDGPRVWVGCLAAYNAGNLHGEWVDVTEYTDELWAAINKVLRTSPEPNIMRQDWECNACGHTFLYQHDPARGLWPGVCASDVCISGDIRPKGKPYPSAEEHFFADNEGFEGFEVGEYESVETVCAVAELIESSEYDGEAVLAFMSHHGDYYDVEGAKAKFDDGVYLGEWDSLEAYAEDYAEQTSMLDSMPENLRTYFDMEAFARDMELGGDVFTLDTPRHTVWIFDNHA